MSRKSQNPGFNKVTPELLGEGLEQANELKQKNREKSMIAKVTPLLWKRSKALEGSWPGPEGDRFRRLREKYMKGEIHWKAFKAFMNKFGWGSEAIDLRKEKRYEKLADHLVYRSTHFMQFGTNFNLILEAMEMDDPIVRAKAEEFVNESEPSILTEIELVKLIKKAKKASVGPESISNELKGKLAIEGISKVVEGSGKKKSLIKELTTNQRESLEGPMPIEAIEGMQESAVETRKAFEEATLAALKVTALIKLLTGDKSALKEKLKDPEYVKEILKTLVKDEALLKRVARLTKDKKIMRALKALQKDRKSYAQSLDPEEVTGETPMQELFIENSAASQLSVRRLEKAVNNNLEPFFEAVLVAKAEGALDDLRDDKQEAKAQITEADVAAKLRETSAELEIDLAVTTQITSALNDTIPLQEKLGEALHKIATYKKPLNNFAQNASLRVGPLASKARRLESMIGVKLYEEDEDEGLYPAVGRKFVLTRPAIDNVVSMNPLERIRKKENGKALPEQEIVELVNVEWIDLGEEDQAHLDEVVPLYKGRQWPGDLKITVKRPNGEIEEIGKNRLTQEFLSYTAEEKIEDKQTAQIRAQEITGENIRFETGEMFLLSSQTVEGSQSHLPAELDVVEIVQVNEQAGTIRLNKPVKLQRLEEITTESSIRNDEVTDTLTYGAFASWLLRRGDQINLMAEDDESETSAGPRMGDGPVLMSRVSNDITPKQLERLKNQRVVSRNVEVKDQQTGRPRWAVLKGPASAMNGKRKVSSHEKYADMLAKAGVGAGHADEDDDEEGDDDNGGHHYHEDEERTHAQLAQDKHNKDLDSKLPPADRGDVTPITELPYDAETKAVNAGDTYVREDSYLRGLWQRTKILACDDFGELFKSMYEYYERHYKRRSKDKYSRVGEGLPYWGTEMGRIKQEAENEEVHHFTEGMEKWSELDVHHAMLKTRNKDQLKACIEVLVKKGQFRWDDVELWENLNHFVPFNLQIPVPGNGDPYLKDKITGRTGFDFLEPVVDKLWGEGTYNEWYSGNSSTYSSNLKKYFEKGKFSEGDIKNNKSVDGELAILLARHKAGGYVDPHEYEGLLHFIIDAGKGSGMETKIYYMIEGVAVKNPVTGRTIMSMERLGAINGEYLNKFPLMDYLTRRDVPRTADGKVRSAWTIHDYERWCNDWDAAAHAEGKPNTPSSKVSHYLWNYILTDEKTITRTNKGLRKAQEMDHDDSYGIIPLADKEQIDTITRQTSGSIPMFTWEGYANAYPGYNMFWKVLAERGDKAKLAKSITAFVRFDGIMSKRYGKDQTTYARLDDTFLSRPSVVDSRPTGWHKTQLQQVLFNVAEAYQDADLINIVKTMHKTTSSTQDATAAAEQKEVQKALENFDKKFMEVIKSDGGARMVQAVQASELSGMGGEISISERRRRKEQFEMENDTLSQTFGDYKRDQSVEGL